MGRVAKEIRLPDGHGRGQRIADEAVARLELLEESEVVETEVGAASRSASSRLASRPVGKRNPSSRPAQL